MISPVSGPGKFAKREDLSRVKKIQREAKIQNATGGTYGQATQLQDIASGASTVQPTPVASASPTNNVGSFARQPRITDIQGTGEPITEGAGGNTPGAGPEVLSQPIDSPDNAALLARAMFAVNPTPQNRRLLEAFLQEGR
jgi:hypothetical protein